MGIPLWAVALIAAAVAPLVVRAIADVLATRAARRTQDALDAATRDAPPRHIYR
jgi:hypothetical protein